MKKVIKTDGTITFVNEAFLDSVLQEGDIVEEMETPSRSNPSAEEISEVNLESLRNARNNMLAESDWTQFPDVPEETRLTWQPYRQALRDITDHYSSLEDVVWPDKPL